MSRTRAFRSFAKINLGLEVTARRGDGYHELKTLFATVSLHDTILITPTRRGITLTCDHESVPNDESNLAHRAAALMLRASGRSGGVAITLKKRIPVGGGLGGGSSNAATVLRALDRIWNVGLSQAALTEAARSLGADVPYFLVGGPALGLGRGDEIQPLDIRLPGRVLIVPGSVGVPTAAVFRRFAADGGVGSRPSGVDRFLRRGGVEEALPSLRNDLEPAALGVNPELAVTRRVLRRVGREQGAVQVAMSGSGSSFFLIFKSQEARSAARADLRQSGMTSLPCAFVSRRAFLSRFEFESRAPVGLLR